MSHFTLVLHEKFTGERISDSEHDTVHAEAAALGFHNTAALNGVTVRLPRGNFFAEAGQSLNVTQLGAQLAALLNRKLSILYSDGPTLGYGLPPVPLAPPIPLSIFLPPQLSPGQRALSASVPPLKTLL